MSSEKGRRFSHLRWKDRLKIERMLKEGHKVKEIAAALHVDSTTIYREIKRGKTVQRTTELIDREIYCPDVAENKYRANLAAKGPALKLGNDYKLAAYIEQKIVEERYSPEAVLLKIKEERLTFSVTLSKWTLYSYITKGVFLGVTNKNLPRKGKKKNKGYRKGPGRAPSTGRQHRRPPGGDRGTSDARRLGDGHGGILQEGRGPAPGADGADVPPGDHHKNAGRHYSERRPVAGQAGKEAGVADVPPDIPHDHRGQWQRVRRLRGHGAVLPDEAGRGRTYTIAIRTAPSSAGSNENANILIRRWLPKGTKLSEVSQAEIKQIQIWMNNYPRMVLGGRCANTALAEWMAAEGVLLPLVHI